MNCLRPGWVRFFIDVWFPPSCLSLQGAAFLTEQSTLRPFPQYRRTRTPTSPLCRASRYRCGRTPDRFANKRCLAALEVLKDLLLFSDLCGRSSLFWIFEQLIMDERFAHSHNL